MTVVIMEIDMNQQLTLFSTAKTSSPTSLPATYRERLIALLSQDLNFHGQNQSYASHNFHAFPAKYPPQLPQKFINSLTNPGDHVLDPMMGSGTTILEATIADRHGIGFDIDPLARLLTTVKTTTIDTQQAKHLGNKILKNAAHALREEKEQLQVGLDSRWDTKTKQFIDYWFATETQLALFALLQKIEVIENDALRAFFELTFSAIIITKSGGVSLSRDLAHTRPHRAKLVYLPDNSILYGAELLDSNTRRLKYTTKKLRSPLEEFNKRLSKNLKSVHQPCTNEIKPDIKNGNAQQLPIATNSIDLIVTSPPYASNAIDYMRAHKFSLVWFGYPIDELGQTRKKYIGGEALIEFEFESIPPYTTKIVQQITAVDQKKGRVLHRYYSEMARTLREMFRVLQPGKAAIVVVGSSVLRGKDTETATCLADLGKSLGFDVPKIGIRQLDRNRRMMPTGHTVNKNSQIQQRMHEEYIIGFLKPE